MLRQGIKKKHPANIPKVYYLRRGHSIILISLVGTHTGLIQVIYKNNLPCKPMKLDPYKRKENYLEWKLRNKDKILGISNENSEIILRYLNDMEKGINVSTTNVKGSRSYCRLHSLKERMIFFSKKFEELYGVSRLVDIKEDQLISLLSDMKNGIVRRKTGEAYLSVETYVKIFKAFWHWYQKTSKKKGIEITDITTDLDSRQEKPKWVYLTEEQVKQLCENAKYGYKVLIMFLYDTGIRAPTELMNVKVSDLYNNCKELNIRQETSKTFGRKIKLMLCSEFLKDFIKNEGLGKEDYLFKINPQIANQYLKRLALKVLGDGTSEAGEKYSKITMYDFRHNSCCYWLPRYKSESALKYRFGWKDSDKIHYYSELLGMKDTISEEDLLVDVTKTEIEKRLTKAEKDKDILQERVDQIEEKLRQVLELNKITNSRVEIVRQNL